MASEIWSLPRVFAESRQWGVVAEGQWWLPRLSVCGGCRGEGPKDRSLGSCNNRIRCLSVLEAGSEEIELSTAWLPSEGCEGRLCSRLCSSACR